ncbi:MAG TPA: histidine phosphatase family protein, partial [Candidatus Acidoferrales bacterium]|nr:histidine phosphatase family protein [Candidatus Acidoferrales bacterium]
ADVRVDQRLREQELQPDGSLSDFKEPPDAVLERMRAAVGDAAAAHPGGRVLLVTHALAILAYLCEVMRVEVGRLRLLPYYTSVSVVRIKGDRRMVGALADTSHLELD